MNISDIWITLDVLKDDKSKDINEVQRVNIRDIRVTDDVLKFEKSIFVKALHFKNIKVISVTNEASKCDISIENNLSHSLNIFTQVSNLLSHDILISFTPSLLNSILVVISLLYGSLFKRIEFGMYLKGKCIIPISVPFVPLA